ncbi:hypothetical protein [Marinibactrum halimedae]|uniref:hypothetical protein n=1 Tax=Marinibactrum halimedae TaxID=1444977 RepID=UPI001E524189|nr:hypothetical protein [Marinibactrum halimedae]MCD9459199.1 hypothetical protein [Marinibactrum halimedae]
MVASVRWEGVGIVVTAIMVSIPRLGVGASLPFPAVGYVVAIGVSVKRKFLGG